MKSTLPSLQALYETRQAIIQQMEIVIKPEHWYKLNGWLADVSARIMSAEVNTCEVSSVVGEEAVRGSVG
jgi:hypothetical protein